MLKFYHIFQVFQEKFVNEEYYPITIYFDHKSMSLKKYTLVNMNNQTKWNIVVFGDLPIASKVCEYILEQDELNLVGCVLSNPNAHNNDPWLDTPMLEDFCHNNNIKIFTLNELSALNDKLDLGLVCRFSKILKKKTIDLFDVGMINMHGGLLPEFAGPYSCNFSILYGSKMGGGTLHWIDEGIDTGDIIRRCEFVIEDKDTGYTVFQKTQIALCENMKEIIIPILKRQISGYIDQNELIRQEGVERRYFKLGSIEQYKEIKPDDSEELMLRKVRAFDFPGYKPAYKIINDNIVYLRMNY